MYKINISQKPTRVQNIKNVVGCGRRRLVTAHSRLSGNWESFIIEFISFMVKAIDR